MSKRDLLLEIGLEEMPARFVTSSIQQFAAKVQTWLETKKVDFVELQSFSTPRRLAVLVRGVSEAQADIHEEAKGPAKKIALDENGNWSKAALGFCRGQGVNPDDIYFKEINGVEYVHVEKFVKGTKTNTLLPELGQIIASLTFPKNMHWANEELKYVRPIKWLLALFGEEVIPFTIAHAQTDRVTYGHRFLGGKIELSTPEQYERALLGQYVIANASERKQAIVSQLQKLEEEKAWVIPIDEELLEEVNNLVEYPTALFGKFEEEYLHIPTEVLITSMKEHQRYFPVKSTTDDLLPFFVTVRNGDHNHLETVARGNEKVLRARLSDAAFFYNEDKKMVIDEAVTKLNAIVYHEEIGTLGEKVRRVRQLTNEITRLLSFTEADQKIADRAAEICKFDLVTNMVYEFPELQGFMGEKYALQKGEANGVAKAINEHYMPRNAEDSIPETDGGAVLAVAEKLDTIISHFAIGMIPSGSQDPYALRRQATGVVQILLQKNWQLEFEHLLSLAMNFVSAAGFAKLDQQQLEQELLTFFKLRLKHLLQEQGVRHDLIEALTGTKIGVVASFIRKATILNAKKEEAGFKESIEALSRVINIASKAEQVSAVETTLFENEFEHHLYNKIREVETFLATNRDEEQYFQLLVSLQTEINDYFDHTMVMAKEDNVRANRLAVMLELAKIIKGFADVTEIIVK